ncbi:helix-turn-helix domain-containing protein [Mesorhizobium sp. L2C084A000]|uniref:helix-turn-helix domain-containing protein n=1 Tax=Mesorhizobium sp. L2C084A000 TaxID=1287116 RepID=UPI0003D01E43|nr:helix-turn-helix domain-containing protein [Mesorhizobium sp. L2C084A000]ESZ19967.1 hypothetical protein X734_31935 [Mesorhizobium sp. L2C084A000]
MEHVEGDQIHLLLHWQAAIIPACGEKEPAGSNAVVGRAGDVELIRACARLISDKAFAGLLNRAGKRTGQSNGWSQSSLRGLRNTHGIAVYKDGELAARGEVTLTEAARMLNLSSATVLRRIRAGIIPAEQYCKGAPGSSNDRISNSRI